jgi:hypothetical protein
MERLHATPLRAESKALHPPALLDSVAGWWFKFKSAEDGLPLVAFSIGEEYN